MVDVISFDAAIEATADKERTLLLGNGFSSKYFGYETLLAASGLEEGSALRNLFNALKTVDFEAVVRALENAVVVERAYGNGAHADDLESHAQEVREALVTAVNRTHPAHKEDLADELKSGVEFLAKFQTVFTLNYDVILYWLNLERLDHSDGFGLGKESPSGRFRGPFNEEAHCSIFNLHGGLHLFRDKADNIYKAQNTNEGLIATITRTIIEDKRLPLYVAEGTSIAKMARINSVEYLRRCYEKLYDNAAPVFVFGHSADENDEHIYRAIFSSEAKHVYFGVFEPSEEKLVNLNARLAKYKALGNKGIRYTFYDSGSAHVWDAAVETPK